MRPTAKAALPGGVNCFAYSRARAAKPSAQDSYRTTCSCRGGTRANQDISPSTRAKSNRFAAELADWWNIGFRPLPEYKAKVEILHQHCADVGRDPSTLLLSYYGHVSVGRSEGEIERVDPVRPNIYRIAGTPEEVAAEINTYIDFGVQHMMLKFSDYPALGQLELFMGEVVPRLRLG